MSDLRHNGIAQMQIHLNFGKQTQEYKPLVSLDLLATTHKMRVYAKLMKSRGRKYMATTQNTLYTISWRGVSKKPNVTHW
jgi:hypothetical protein